MYNLDTRLYYRPEKKKTSLKFLVLALLVAIGLFSAFLIYQHYFFGKTPATISNENKNINNANSNGNVNANVNSNINANINSAITIPDKKTLKVPFTTQAPHANWDMLHEEACEEASLIMYFHFSNGTNITGPDAAEQEIQDLIAYEEANGYKVDVTVAELKEIASKYYGMKTGRIIKNPSIDDIKEEIVLGHPVIVPAAGKMLDNPNFRNGGPKYHMLVLKGYDKDGWITNDPGTRKGEYFRYTYDNLYNAIHDWDDGDITNGAKNVLVFD